MDWFGCDQRTQNGSLVFFGRVGLYIPLRKVSSSTVNYAGVLLWDLRQKDFGTRWKALPPVDPCPADPTARKTESWECGSVYLAEMFSVAPGRRGPS
jgi:hypothetical protein